MSSCFARSAVAVAFRRGLLLALALMAAGAQGAALDQPLRISANGRYLIDRHDVPFLLQGDAAWSLIANLSNEDAERYLKDRHDKGFNAVLVNLLEYKFAKNPPRNLYGEAPFADMKDWSHQNEAYFQHADWVIRKAAEYGIVVLLAPVYLGYPGAGEGFYDEVLANGPEHMLEYGEFLGRRYKDFDNVLWVMGGDRNPGEAREDVDMVAYGIRELDHRHLFTAHCFPESNPIEQYPGSWLDIDTTYTYLLPHRKLIDDYNRRPTKPNFLIESSYEGEHNSSAVQIRRQAYWAILSGAFGQVFGNRPIWLFDPGWQAALESTGSSDMMRWGRLFRSRRWFDLVPDQKHVVVTGGLGEFNGLDYLSAARTVDGTLVMAYMPSARTVTIDMTQIAGRTARVSWMDPSTGKSRNAGRFTTVGSREFTPPRSGDWVLILHSDAGGAGRS
jgi:hypothetical protein